MDKASYTLSVDATIASGKRVALSTKSGTLAFGGDALVLVRTLLYFPNREVSPKYHHVTDSILSMITTACNEAEANPQSGYYRQGGSYAPLSTMLHSFINSDLYEMLK